MKQEIKLSESQLISMIENTISSIITEESNNSPRAIKNRDVRGTRTKKSDINKNLRNNIKFNSSKCIKRPGKITAVETPNRFYDPEGYKMWLKRQEEESKLKESTSNGFEKKYPSPDIQKKRNEKVKLSYVSRYGKEEGEKHYKSYLDSLNPEEKIYKYMKKSMDKNNGSKKLKESIIKDAVSKSIKELVESKTSSKPGKRIGTINGMKVKEKGLDKNGNPKYHTDDPNCKLGKKCKKGGRNFSSYENFTPYDNKKTLKEEYEEQQYANVSNEDINNFDNYYEVIVPDSCLCYLVNGDTEGYEDYEIEKMKDFEQKWFGKLSNGLNVGDCCIPTDNAEPSFEPYNDVYGKLGCDCYRFLLPC